MSTTPAPSPLGCSGSVQGVVRACREQLQPLYAAVAHERARALQRWQEEEPMLECQIEALAGTREIIQREQRQLSAELANLKAHLDKQAAEAAKQAPAVDPGSGREAALQQQLEELAAKIAELDAEVTAIVPQLARAGGAAGACRADEVSYYETKLVVIQDTRRLLHAESAALAGELKRRQAASRLQADGSAAAQLGLSDLGRLGERLAGVEAALDRAKLDRYFPQQRGFRFSGGGGGIYCGVKDLHWSELSGAFSLSIEGVQQAPGGAAAAGRSSGSSSAREVRLKVTLSGISASASSTEYKQQQEQQRQAQADKAATQARFLKLEQQHQQQQAALSRSSSAALHGGGSTSTSSPAKQQPQQPQQALPTRAAAAAAHGSSIGSSSFAGPGGRRNAAIAKFLGQLNDKKDSLSNALKAKGLGDGAAASQTPVGATLGAAAGFGARFGAKAAGFSSHLAGGGDVTGDVVGVPGGSRDGLMPGLAGLRAPAAVAAADGGAACAAAAGEARLGGGSSNSSVDGGVQSSAAVSSSCDAAAAAAAGVPQLQPATTPPHSPARPLDAGVPGVLHSSGSGGSGNWQQRQQQLKGKLGGFLNESKQKLADSKARLADSKLVQESRAALAESKAKLQESKLVQESRAALAESKAKLADSKLFVESRAAAKGLLADSRHLLEDSRAGLRRGMEQLASKAQHQQPGGGSPGGSDRGSFEQQRQGHGQGGSHSARASLEGPAAAAAGTPVASPPKPDAAADAGATGDNTPAAAAAAAPADEPDAAAAAAPADEACTPDANATGGGSCPAAAASAAPPAPAEGSGLPAAGGGLLGGAAAGAAAAAAACAAEGPSATAAGGVDGAKPASSRRGVVVMLLAEGLEVLGEKGTKVPNIRAARLGLEVECVLSASLTYSRDMGWQSAGLAFEVVSLERVVEGANLPVPKTLLRSVLNIVMPSVFNKLLLTSLPHELGQFILDSAAAAASSSSSSSRPRAAQPAPACRKSSEAPASPASATSSAVAAAGGAGMWLAGELSLSGPPLACLTANLATSADDAPKGRADLGGFVQELRAAQKARALLGLQEPLHARALTLLFSADSPFCLLRPNAGSSTSGSGDGSSGAVQGLPPSASVALQDVCRFWLEHSDSSAWPQICSVWQRAVDAVTAWLVQQEGGGGGSAQQQHQQQSASADPPAHSFDFAALMGGRVAALVRKPVRLSFGLNRLLLGLDAAAGLTAARDYCERCAREFAEQAKGDDALLLLQRPLSQQLELLHLWHAALSARLAAFLQQFKAAGGRILLAADKSAFSVVLEGLGYEGPLRLAIPLPLLADITTGACSWDVALPNPAAAAASLASKLRFVTAALSRAAFGVCEDEVEAAKRDAAAAAAAQSGVEAPLTMLEELDALLSLWNAASHQQQHQAAVNGHAGSSISRGGSGLQLSRGCSGNSAAAAAAVSRTTSRLAAAAHAAEHAGDGASASPANGALPASAAAAGVIGRVSLTRAAAGLVLDDRRLRELLGGSGATQVQDGGVISGLLSCYGELFTASIAPGWPQHQQQQHVPAAAPLDSDGGSPRSPAAAAAVPQAIVKVQSNEVTRVRAELEAAAFESAVPPRVAVRLLHMLLLAVVHKFSGSGDGSSKRLAKLNKVFRHVAEYLGRDVLDLLLCVHVAATAQEAAGHGTSGSALQLLVAGAAPAGGGGGGSGSGGSGGGACCYFINEVNLLTVLDTVRLLMDA